MTARAEQQAPTEELDRQAKAGVAAAIQEFARRANANCIEKFGRLHWKYQESMKDHLGRLLPDWIATQRLPKDLGFPDTHKLQEMAEPHVLLCCSTFKRDFQIKETLTLNLPQTMPWGRRVTWCVFDANVSEDLWDWARSNFSFPLQCGHLIWLRCAGPGWESFHMSKAKNTAHYSGMDASLEDRMQRCSEAGLTANKDELAKRIRC